MSLGIRSNFICRTNGKPARLIESAPRKEGEEKRYTAFVTVAVDRSYPSTVNGEKVKETTWVELRFLNSAAQSIAKYLPDGSSRRLNIEGEMVQYWDKRDFIFVEENGQYVKKLTKMEHAVKLLRVDVKSWEFLDSNPEKGATVTSGETIDDLLQEEGGEVAPSTASKESGEELPPVFQPNTFTPEEPGF
jgi:single-stranded DNA-binding protein